MTAKNEETMFTITTIPNKITIGRDLPPTSPAVRLDERGIQVNGVNPLDLAPGESTIVEYPISERDETPIRRLRCKVTRDVLLADIVSADEELAKHAERGRDALREAFAPSPETVEMLRAMDAPKPSSLAATIKCAREASENAPAPRRGGRRSARRSES